MRPIKFRAWDGNQSASHKDGEYIYVKAEWHPYANKRGYVKRHRLILEKHIGKYLPRKAIVHHINGNKHDDRIENLVYYPDQKNHAKEHDNGIRNENGQFVAVDNIFSEIKFRLYNKHTKLYEIHTLGKLIKTTFRNSQFTFAGRFTGLHDKNGNEIYEGDKISFLDTFRSDTKEYSNGIIEFKDGSFCIVTEFITHYRLIDYDMEVIGNIYEKEQ